MPGRARRAPCLSFATDTIWNLNLTGVGILHLNDNALLPCLEPCQNKDISLLKLLGAVGAALCLATRMAQTYGSAPYAFYDKQVPFRHGACGLLTPQTEQMRELGCGLPKRH